MNFASERTVCFAKSFLLAHALISGKGNAGSTLWFANYALPTENSFAAFSRLTAFNYN